MVVQQIVLTTLHLMRSLLATNFESTIQNNFEEITMIIYLNQSRAFLITNKTTIVFMVIMSCENTHTDKNKISTHLRLLNFLFNFFPLPKDQIFIYSSLILKLNINLEGLLRVRIYKTMSVFSPCLQLYPPTPPTPHKKRRKIKLRKWWDYTSKWNFPKNIKWNRIPSKRNSKTGQSHIMIYLVLCVRFASPIFFKSDEARFPPKITINSNNQTPNDISQKWNKA